MGLEILVGAALLGAGASAVQAYDARKDAKKSAKKQQALVAKQEAKIQAEKDKQLKEQEQRRQRAATSELLTGTETGITDKPKGTLLGATNANN